MKNKRRVFLKNILGGLAGIFVASVIKPMRAFAAWPAELFNAADIKGALGGKESTATEEINLKTPDIAENGAVVPVTVETNLSNVETITILVKENQRPLSAVFILGPGVQPNISTRIKMAKTSEVIAVVKSGEKRLSASKEVKVTIGGCGG